MIQHAVEGTRIYLHDNVGPHRPAGLPAGEKETAIVDGRRTAFSTDQAAFESSGLRAEPVEQALAHVLQKVGAVVPVRDAVDVRIVEQVRQGTGRMIDSPNDVAGYPSYGCVRPPVDTDQDGMPDAWEIQRGLDPRKADGTGRKLDPNYDHVEVYVNSLFSDE